MHIRQNRLSTAQDYADPCAVAGWKINDNFREAVENGVAVVKRTAPFRKERQVSTVTTAPPLFLTFCYESVVIAIEHRAHDAS
jgi:hypothetical protein